MKLLSEFIKYSLGLLLVVVFNLSVAAKELNLFDETVQYLI